MKDLNEAIKHSLDVAEEQKGLFKVCPRSEQEPRCDGTKDCRSLKYGKDKGCLKCANDHMQLANWLMKLQRADILLRATYELLKKQEASGYVLNLLAETVEYDNLECDGSCLMEDIEGWLDEF